jgi:hypothetical protein
MMVGIVTHLVHDTADMVGTDGTGQRHNWGLDGDEKDAVRWAEAVVEIVAVADATADAAEESFHAYLLEWYGRRKEFGLLEIGLDGLG